VKQKTFIILLIAIVVAGGAIGGAFMGGVAMGKSQGQQSALQNLRSQFTTRQGQTGTQNGAVTSGTDVPAAFGGAFIGRGTAGTVSKIENGVITLTARDGSTIRVITSASTTVQKTGTVTLNDIVAGESVSVTGETQQDGSVKATSIFVTTGLPGAVPASTSP